jgi:hypothetical protein
MHVGRYCAQNVAWSFVRCYVNIPQIFMRDEMREIFSRDTSPFGEKIKREEKILG